MRRFLFLLPTIVFAILVAFFGWRLLLISRGNAPEIIPSVMINKPAPHFDLPPLLTGTSGFKTTDLKGKVTLVNFFASWCLPCRAEHPMLDAIAGKGARLVGIAWKNKPTEAQSFIAQMGNPYDVVVTDIDGHTALDFGVYGVPETYLIDKNGVIRFKEPGPLTPEIIRNQLLPLIREMNR